MLDPQSLNVITQHLEAPAGERFDLVIATNILLYYDRFEQALALLNIESMLDAGGVLLSNDLVEDYSGVKLHTLSAVSVLCSPTQADDVHIYSAAAFQPQIAPT